MGYDANNKPICDWTHGCTAPVARIDDKGYVYCVAHGAMRGMYRRVRKLTQKELNLLQTFPDGPKTYDDTKD